MTIDFDSTATQTTHTTNVRPLPAAVSIPESEPAPSSAPSSDFSNEPFSLRARSAIARLLLQGDASVSQVARELSTSNRTLQRRLQEDGTTLQDLVASVRFELAVELLSSPSRSASEVSTILGFSAPSAFHRAFKRWTGHTPGQFRKQRVRDAITHN